MYRNILNRSRAKKQNLINMNLINNEIKSKKKKKQITPKKPINFNNGDHLGEYFHFLLKKEYQLRKNSNDLPPFLL
tara:strand:- start:4563 stop:4790 length:228 start_codon:yes stop_codon:yes gene_type:complete